MRAASSPVMAALALAFLARPACAGSAPQETTMKETPQAAAAGSPRTCLLPSQSSPLVTFRIQFGAGSIDDPPGKEGLNALTALTIGEGGTKELTYREVTDGLAVRGNLVTDAHLATLLRQHGVRRLYSADADFRRFAFLDVRDPFS